jgi:hypothetical protein
MSNENITQLKNVTNDLILKYDENFNELYDKKVNIDSSIKNKEELIIKINDEINNKNNKLQILQYTNIAILIFGVIIILYGLEKISLSMLLILTVILIIVYLLVITFTIYIHLTAQNVVKNINGVTVQMTEYIDSVIAKELNFKCPATCSVNQTLNGGPTIMGYAQPTLKIDPQLNVWQYGDVPSDLYTTTNNPASTFYTNYIDISNFNKTDEEQRENMPKSVFSTTYPNSTYYKCQWNGGTGINGLPNTESSTYSSIPCSYRPNFTETGRYICRDNPNKFNGDDDKIKDICDDVSYSLT